MYGNGENMKERERCDNCGYYKAYYTQGYCRFEKERCGFCQTHKKIVQGDERCEWWRSNVYAKRIRQAATAKVTSELLPRFLQALQIAEENANVIDDN